MSDSDAQLPAYIALLANNGERVLIPAGAAGRSRLLHDLLEGLYITHAAMAAKAMERAAGGEGPVVDVLCDRTDLYSAMAAAESVNGIGAVPVTGGGEELYQCYARAYPMFQRRGCGATANVLRGKEATSEGSSLTAKATVTADTPSPLLEVPLTCVEAETLCRIAEFLVLKSCNAARGGAGGSGGYANRTDPLRDLDCTSAEDQLTVIRLLLGSDLLGC